MEQINLSGGVHIHYRVAGTGPALLLQHGWGGSSLYWQSTVANLSDLRTVYAIDLPGYGQSPPMTLEAAHPERLAILLIEFADAVGLEHIDLIGHSFGANLVSYVAANYPSRVGHLVLTCPATYRNDRERQMVRFVHRLMGLTLRMRRPWVGRIPPVYRRISRRFFYRLPDDNVLLREGFKDFLRMDRQTATQSALNAVDDSINKVFRRIEVPTLIVGASNDQIMPRHGPSTVAQLIPESRLVWIEQCGHLPMVERPEAYHWLVRDFLSNGATSEEMPLLAEGRTRMRDSMMMTRDGRPAMGNQRPTRESERPAAATPNRRPATGAGRPAEANRGTATNPPPMPANRRPMAANRGGFMDNRSTDATQRAAGGAVGRPAVAPTQKSGQAKQKVAVDVGDTHGHDVYAASNGEQQQDVHIASKGDDDTHRADAHTTAKQHGDTEKQATATPSHTERQEVYTPPRKERQQQQHDSYSASKRDRQDTYAPPSSKSASPSTTARPQHGSGSARDRQQDAYAASPRPAAASMVHTGKHGQQAMVASRRFVDVSWAEAQQAAQQAAEVAAYQTEVAAQQAAAALNQQAAADAARQVAEVAQEAAAEAQRVAALAALQATEEVAMQMAALAEQQTLAARQASAAAEAHQTALEIAQRMAVEFEHL